MQPKHCVDAAQALTLKPQFPNAEPALGSAKKDGLRH